MARNLRRHSRTAASRLAVDAMTDPPRDHPDPPSITGDDGPPRLAGIAAFVACLTLVLLAGLLLEREIRARDDARFQRAVATVENRIVSRFDTTATLLRGAAGLFAATPADAVDATAFRRFVQRTRLEEMHPEIQGLGFSRLVAAEEVAALPAELERQGLPRVELRPPGAGERHAIVFLEPLDRRNVQALGFDMNSEPARREAMDRARDVALPSLSGRVKLLQEIDAAPQPGFLVYAPVYREGTLPGTVEARRAAFRGVVYVPVRAHDFFDRLFDGVDLVVDFAVHDGDRADPAELLFGPVEMVGGLTAERRLAIAGRTWTIRYASNSRFDAAGSRGDLILLGGVGLLASVVVLVLVRRQAAARHAEEKARRAEEKRRQQAEALAAELVALSEDVMREIARRREDAQP